MRHATITATSKAAAAGQPPLLYKCQEPMPPAATKGRLLIPAKQGAAGSNWLGVCFHVICSFIAETKQRLKESNAGAPPSRNIVEDLGGSRDNGKKSALS